MASPYRFFESFPSSAYDSHPFQKRLHGSKAYQDKSAVLCPQKHKMRAAIAGSQMLFEVRFMMYSHTEQAGKAWFCVCKGAKCEL